MNLASDARALLNEDPRRCEWRIQNRGTVLHAWGVIDEQRPRASAVTTSPDQHRGPQQSELEAIRDANANTPQRDNYADDPNVLERFGDDRDAEVAVEVAAFHQKLLAAALDALDGFVARYVHFESEAQRVAVVLWIAATYIPWGEDADAFDVAAYLHIKSPEKQSGKTLLLEVIEFTAKDALLTSNISAAALYRVMDSRHPTLLIDEIDAVFPSRKGSGDPSREEFRALLNNGYKKGGKVFRMGGPRHDQLQEFSAFGPKGLAGIGELPDTIADRAIPIRLQRKPRSVKVSRWRRRLVKEEAAEVAGRLGEALAEFSPPVLEEDWPELPDQLSDREQELWEPLLSVADLAGGGWLSRALLAAVQLHTGTDRAGVTLGVQLLADIRAVWPDREKVFTRDLLASLNALEESPWGDWYGRPFDARRLAKTLRPYGPRSRKVNVDGTTLQGWQRADFEDPWNRYLVKDSGSSVKNSTEKFRPDPLPHMNSSVVPDKLGGDDRPADVESVLEAFPDAEVVVQLPNKGTRSEAHR